MAEEKTIVVLVKQINEPEKVEIDRKTGQLNFETAALMINPNDRNALEAALLLKEAHPGEFKITAMSIGGPETEDALREAMSMGADDAILLTDPAFEDGDAWSVAVVLADAIKRLPGYALIFGGERTADSHGAQVGPYLAELLDLPQVTAAGKIELKGDDLEAERIIEGGFEKLQLPLPAVVTVDPSGNKPRYPSAGGIFGAYHEKNLTTWGLADLELKEGFSAKGARRVAYKGLIKREEEKKGEKVSGAPTSEMVETVVKRLKNKNLIK